MFFNDLTELIDEAEFAKLIQVPLSRLKKWRKVYGARECETISVN